MSAFVRRPAVRRRDRTLSRSVLLLVLALYTATFAGLPTSELAELEFQATRSLARGPGDELEAEEVRSVAPAACFALAPAALGVPLYWIGWLAGRALPDLEARHVSRASVLVGTQSEYAQHVAVGWRNALLGALTAWLLVPAARRLGASRRSAWLAALGYAFASYAWPAARTNLSPVPGAFFALLALHLTLRIRERYTRVELPRARELAGVGLALGLAWLSAGSAPWTVPVLALGVAHVVASGERRLRGVHWPALPRQRRPLATWLWIAGPLAAGILLGAAVDAVRAGPLGSPCPSELGRLLAVPEPLAAARVLVSPGQGLLWTAPLLVLVPFGIAEARAKGERLWLVVAPAVLAAALAYASKGVLGAAAWSYGPHDLLAALPILWLGVALALDASRRFWARALSVGLLVLGVLVQLPAVAVDAATHRDLAMQAAALRWPAEAPERRAELIAWDWGFAAPWAHWRILRHRMSRQEEAFSAEELFRFPSDALLVPADVRGAGFGHLAWVDYRSRLGGGAQLLGVVVAVLLAAGFGHAWRGLGREPT